MNIANHDRLHRNRIGINACHDLRDLLNANKIISSLNIADNRIGNDGLTVIAPALTSACVLVIFDLSNNELEGEAVIDSLSNYLKTSQILLELNLSSNRLGDGAMSKLADIFETNRC